MKMKLLLEPSVKVLGATEDLFHPQKKFMTK